MPFVGQRCARRFVMFPAMDRPSSPTASEARHSARRAVQKAHAQPGFETRDQSNSGCIQVPACGYVQSTTPPGLPGHSISGAFSWTQLHGRPLVPRQSDSASSHVSARAYPQRLGCRSSSLLQASRLAWAMNRRRSLTEGYRSRAGCGGDHERRMTKSISVRWRRTRRSRAAAQLRIDHHSAEPVRKRASPDLAIMGPFHCSAGVSRSSQVSPFRRTARPTSIVSPSRTWMTRPGVREPARSGRHARRRRPRGSSR